MVRVVSRELNEVQVEAAVLAEAAEEVRHEFGPQIAERLDAKVHAHVRPGAPRQIDAAEDEGIVERDGHRAETSDAALIAERFVDRAAERDPDVFDDMMVIETVAARLQGQAAAGVLRERGKHMVEERYAG